MIVHCWNVRGLNSPLKQHEVAGLMKSKKFDVCGLLETKLSLAKVACMHKLRLKSWQFVSNADVAIYARIIVLWNPETVKVELLHSTAQGIHVQITCLVQQFCFTATFIYGFNTITARRALWDDLRRWGTESPWLLLGDFNSILSQEDKHNGEPVSTYETSYFRECCSDLGIADLNSTGSYFTWTNGTIWTKINRVMANTQWFSLQQMVHVHFGTPGAFSDHSPSTVHLGTRELCGKRNFKFFNMWATHPQFLATVSQHWSLDTYGSHMYILCKKLKLLKGGLKNLNNLHFSHISERVARAGKELDVTQLLLQNDRDNSHLLALKKQQRLNLVNLKSAEKMFFGQKLKCTFFRDCDKGTRFFHSLMSQRYRRHHIPAILQSDGTLTSSAEEVGRVFVSYYQELLGTSKHTIPLQAEVVQSGACINADSHDFLLAPVSVDDIKRVLFSMDDNKASSPDGYTSAFFKQAWNIVGEDLCSAVQDFFASGEILKQLNHSTIALVPKSANANCAADYRPISCCNVTYKVISKILAERLAHVLNDIISPSQNAFLGGRLMADNINLMQELLRSYGRKRISPRCIIKIDFRKAFDSVQWSFLRDLLHLLGFPARFVHLVMKCVETASFSVCINGNLFGFFQARCGVRQGDPLSPYLFIICMEYFSRLLKSSTQHSGFSFHPKCHALEISHLGFADDILLLCRCDMVSINIILQQLRVFGESSGLVLNAAKSSIFFAGVTENMKKAILSFSQFTKGNFPFKYLGVPLSPHRPLASQFSPLIHKLEMAIQSWMGKYLSYAGRLELIKSVLHGMVQFWINIFPILNVVINKITSLCRNFLWTGDVLRSKSSLVAWKQVCLPKEEGGLAVLDIKARNDSFFAKHLWNIHLKSDSLWIRWVDHYYISHASIWSLDAKKTDSPLWKSIFSLRNKMIDLCGGVASVQQLLSSWHSDLSSFTSCAYAFFRHKADPVQWASVVWEPWSLPRHSFSLWLAMLGKLRTRDRLQFLSSDTLCPLCQNADESHAHLFFQCAWSSSLWSKTRYWLKLHNNIPSLNRATRVLHNNKKGLQPRMRRVSLAILVYLIWEERNRRIFNSIEKSVEVIFRRFQILFYTILYFHDKNPLAYSVAN